jgi:hypothetical protein
MKYVLFVTKWSVKFNIVNHLRPVSEGFAGKESGHCITWY